MSRLKRAIHDVWCGMAHRCGFDRIEDTPILRWLRDQEQEARQRAQQTRERAPRVNMMEAELMRKRFNREDQR